MSSIMELLESIKDSAYFKYLIIIICMYIGHSLINRTNTTHESDSDSDSEEEEDLDPPRNFTSAQLLKFDGSPENPSDESSALKPVYLSLAGKVFDVSKGRDFYGPGGPYALFAGHECGVALAKMSFSPEHLDDHKGVKSLNPGEKSELHSWTNKFEHYRCYPVVGSLIPDDKLPDPERILTREDIAKCDGGEDAVLPKGYATKPLYIGAGTKVFDASFGGVTFYGEGCPYNLFVGRDASRALGKMSLKVEDLDEGDGSLEGLTEKEVKIMEDWIKTFEERKMYPIVGRLEK